MLVSDRCCCWHSGKEDMSEICFKKMSELLLLKFSSLKFEPKHFSVHLMKTLYLLTLPFIAVLSIVLTCVCMINSLDGSLSQIYYSVHFKWPQVLFVQSNVSQKGSWNTQTGKTHVSRLWGNSRLWSIRLSRPVASSASCHLGWVGCMEGNSKGLWKAWSM